MGPVRSIEVGPVQSIELSRRLPNHQFEHNTLRAGPLDLTLDLASVIPDAMVGFVNKHLRTR